MKTGTNQVDGQADGSKPTQDSQTERTTDMNTTGKTGEQTTAHAPDTGPAQPLFDIDPVPRATPLSGNGPAAKQSDELFAGNDDGQSETSQTDCPAANREYEFHPASELFPVLSDRELRKLAADIRDHGLREPIWLYEGKILDGRNRYKACAIAGVQPTFDEYTGDAPARFTFSMNFHRRHLEKGQLAALAVEFIPYLAAEAKKRQQEHGGTAPGRPKNTRGNRATSDSAGEKGKARDKAARMTGVSSRYVSDAKKLQQEAPDLFKELKSGTKTIPRAMSDLECRCKPQRRKSGNKVTERPPIAELALIVVVGQDGTARVGTLNGTATTPALVADALSRVYSGLRDGAIVVHPVPQDAHSEDGLCKVIADHLKPAPAATVATNPECGNTTVSTMPSPSAVTEQDRRAA